MNLCRPGSALLAAGTAALATWSAGCASSNGFRPTTIWWDEPDPVGDVRLKYPGGADLDEKHFDLVRTVIGKTDNHLIVRLTFDDDVELIRFQRPTEYVPESIYPQTVDIYLDTTPDHGELSALPDRGFYVPAAEAYDVVLLLSSIRALHGDNVVRPVHMLSQGRDLIGVFKLADIPGTPAGALVTVSATAPLGDGRIRRVSRQASTCSGWDPYFRCTLTGEGPAVLDASVPIRVGEPVSLTYFDGVRPAPKQTPVVFARGRLIGAAPVDSERVRDGALATLYDAKGKPMGTAVVVSVVDDTASLEWVAESAGTAAADSAAEGERPLRPSLPSSVVFHAGGRAP